MINEIISVKEFFLQILYGDSGFPRKVNGETYRCLIGKRAYFSKEYDNNVAAYFRSKISPGDTCVSIGANMGIYPLQFAKWVGSAGKVLAYEPNPDTIQILQKHIIINGFVDQIKIIPKAISKTSGKAEFHAYGTDGKNRLGEANPLLIGMTKIIEVDVTTIDQEFMAEQIDAIMMDIEGFEIAALNGAHEFLQNRRLKAFVIEMHPDAWNVAGTTRQNFDKIIREYRLKVIPLSGQSDPLGEHGHIAIENI